MRGLAVGIEGEITSCLVGGEGLEGPSKDIIFEVTSK